MTHVIKYLSLILILLLFASVTLAQGSYNLSWWTVDGGGGQSSGGGYSLASTIGQADAGVMGGGTYTLVGGFWSGGIPAGGPEGESLYLPIVLKNR